MADAQQLAGLLQLDLALAGAMRRQPNSRLPQHRQVREQAGFLEHTHRAFVRGKCRRALSSQTSPLTSM
jgi:hypothetical protein